MEGIKVANLKHCLAVLKNNVPDEGFKVGIGIDFEIGEKVFKDILKKYEKKKDFLTKARDGFKEAVFKLCRTMIGQEEFPKRFDETTLLQMYKGKGNREDLENSRYIHMKDWLPRTCDSMLVELMKAKILASSSIFQIGGRKGTEHRSIFLV